MFASAETATKTQQKKKRPTFAKEKIQCGIIPTQEITRSKILMKIYIMSMCQCDKTSRKLTYPTLGKGKSCSKVPW